MSIVAKASWLALVLGMASTATAQRTWTVDLWNRPGADFTDLPAAVTAASSGDVLLLRVTSGLRWGPDCYQMPTIQGKGLTIVGESGAGLPPVFVMGMGSVTGVPASESLIFANVVLGGLNSFEQLPFGRAFALQVTNCAGAVVFRGVTLQHMTVFTDSVWTNIGLLVFESCQLYPTEGRFWILRSKIMMSNTLLSRQGSIYTNQLPALMLTTCDVHMERCTAIGASSSAVNPLNCSPALDLRDGTTLRLSGGCHVEGGTWSGGRCIDIIGVVGVHHLYYDASTFFAGGMVAGGDPNIVMSPQTGIRTLTSGTTIHVDQSQPSSTLTLMVMSPLITTPWTNLIGPVFVDPNFSWTSLDLAPATGSLRRSFTIPPSIPLGQFVGVQAFALDPQTNNLLTSNATVVGVW